MSRFTQEDLNEIWGHISNKTYEKNAAEFSKTIGAVVLYPERVDQMCMSIPTQDGLGRSVYQKTNEVWTEIH